MINFLLNNTEITTRLPPGMVLLDYIRYERNLKGTKIGCREGDCGACTVLIGDLKNDDVVYTSATSCLTALGSIRNKHIVTVEGVNMDNDGLNPIQQAMCNEAGTQCGFCTPGFIVSMAGFCLSDKEPTTKNALASIDGNICRCTGYKSIERALSHITELMQARNGQNVIDFVMDNNILPAYFVGVKNRLKALYTNSQTDALAVNSRFVGGGTDLYVQQHDNMVYASIDFLTASQTLKAVTKRGDECIIGAATTVSELIDSPLIQQHFPQIREMGKLISSTPIRNMATLAGNFVNGSPIGDFSIFFLALNATITLTNGNQTREVPLDQFYKGYKQLDKQADEYISSFRFTLPDKNTLFNFEKVSKRMHLDIASVNTAVRLKVEHGIILDTRISAGGVAPFPLLLKKTSAFLTGKEVTEELITEATELLQTEIAPISDARGTEEYKRLLLSQLIKAHFIKLFPLLQVDKLLV